MDIILNDIKKSIKYGFDPDKHYRKKEIYLSVRRFYGINKKSFDRKEEKFKNNQLEDLYEKLHYLK